MFVSNVAGLTLSTKIKNEIEWKTEAPQKMLASKEML